MSTTCSIPGCNKRTSLTDDTKLYRVPAVAIGSSETSGLIYNLTNERRKKWFEVLEMCGLNEDNSASYRVCSNHFKDGKPSPMFDSKNIDWVPSINLPFSENVIEKQIVEVTDNKDKRRQGRQNRRNTKRINSSERNGPVRSKSVERSRAGRNTNLLARSKSVCRSKFLENENLSQKKSSEQPFVFVDIKKIKEGAPIAFKEQTPRPQSPEEGSCDVKIQTISLPSTTFDSHTDPDVLPSLNCVKNDSHYQTLGVQTNPVNLFQLSLLDNSFQACLGEMIEFVRTQMLDYNLKALGKGFRIKECALHFQKEGEEDNIEDEEANTVVVHPTRLLSSNCSLLEAVAISLDLYRVQDKNVKSCYSRILSGKTETIEKISNNFDGNESWRNQLKEVSQNNEYALREVLVNAVEKRHNIKTESSNFSTEKDATISPVMPRITSVISIGELLKDSTPSKSPAKQRAPRKKKPGANWSFLKSSRQRRQTIPYIKNKKLTRLEMNSVVQGILGTSKVPRVVLSKLPDSVFENGGSVPNCASLSYPTPSSSKVPTGVSSEGDGSPTEQSGVSLKLPQPSSVSGFLLVPDVSGKMSLMYVPKLQTKAVDLKPDNLKEASNTELELTKKNTALFGSPPCDLNITNVIHSPKITKLTEPKVTKEAIPRLPSKHLSLKDVTITKRAKKINNSDKNNQSASKDDVDKKESAKADIEVEIPNGGELRCPYCLKNCKDGLDFINHHKTTGCKNKKSPVPIKTINRKRGRGSKSIHDCNVCGKVFVKEDQLDIHLQMHVEYEVWDKKCAECPKKFASQEELQDHISERHIWKIKIAKFQCKECEKSFTTRKRLECHVEKKHPSTVKKRSSVARICCTVCRDVFELQYYRKIHWRECQEKKKEQDHKELIRQGIYNSSEQTDKVKINKLYRNAVKIKVTKKNLEDDKMIRGSHKVDDSETLERKPTAIRTIRKESLNDDLEVQLSKMFQEVLEDSSSSEYEQEELLDEGYEDEVLSRNKSDELNETKESHKGMKRLMSLDKDEVFELPPVKIAKVEENIEKRENDELNSSSINESEIKDQKKIDIKSLLNVNDSTNDIVIEELEDDEYFSMDESTH